MDKNNIDLSKVIELLRKRFETGSYNDKVVIASLSGELLSRWKEDPNRKQAK